MNKKLIAPIVTAAAMLATSIGSTFALFTSKASSRIDVNAGRVAVNYDASVSKALSRYLDEEPWDAIANKTETHAATFENGSTADISVESTGAVVTLDRLAPMDMIELKVGATNNSNINIKFRYFIKASGDLLPALDLIVDGASLEVPGSSLEFYSAWSSVMTPDVESLFEKNIGIYFPDHGEDDNQYQEKTATLEVGIEAIQGNAEVHDPVDPDPVEEPEEIHSKKPSQAGKSVNMESKTGSQSYVVPFEACKESAEELVLTIIPEEEPTAEVPAGKDVLPYDIHIEGIKEDNTAEIEARIGIGQGKTNVQVFHNGAEIESKYVEDEGSVYFKATSFSPYDVVFDAARETGYGFYNSYKVDEGLETEHWVHEISNVSEFRNMWMDAYFQKEAVHYPGYLEEETVYLLIKDVDFDGASTYGENFSTWESYAFSGIFDGDEFSLSGISNTESYLETDRIGGMFSNLGRPATIKDVTLDNVVVKQANSDKGVGLIAGGLEISTAASILVLDNVHTNITCSLEGNEKCAGFIGCCRGYQSVTISNCSNSANVISSGKNSSGFLGTSSYTKNFTFTNSANYGKILSTNSAGFVAGFVSQAQSASSITFTNCVSGGEIDNRSGAANISWFVGHRAGTLNYSNNVVSAQLTVKNESYVTEKSQTGISGAQGELADYINIVNCPKIDVSFDVEESLTVTPVDGADHYEVNVSVGCLKGTVSGDTFTQTNDTDYVYNYGNFADVNALKEVKRITRVGHVLSPTVTKFDTHYECQGISSNHYRLDSKGSYIIDQPAVENGVNGAYLVFGNEGSVVSINFYETVWLIYNIIAKDASGTVLASSSWRFGGSSASPFMNMASQWYKGSAPSHITPIIL